MFPGSISIQDSEKPWQNWMLEISFIKKNEASENSNFLCKLISTPMNPDKFFEYMLSFGKCHWYWISAAAKR